MKQKTSMRNIGGSNYVLIPPALVEYLGLEVGTDTVQLEDKENEKKRFVVISKKEE